MSMSASGEGKQLVEEAACGALGLKKLAACGALGVKKKQLAALGGSLVASCFFLALWG